MESPKKIVTRRRISSRLEKIYVILSCVLMGAIMMTVPAFAEGGGGDVGGAMGKLLNVIGVVGFWVGVGLMAFGVYEIIMSVIQSQPEAKTKGITLAVVGAVLMGLTGILQAMDLTSGAPSVT